MSSKWLIRSLEAAAATVVLLAICQELQKPKSARTWHDKVAGLIPYDFRLPTPAALADAYWNPYDDRIFTPPALGIGWAVNFHALLDKLGLLSQSGPTEEDFLMPDRQMKQMLQAPPHD